MKTIKPLFFLFAAFILVIPIPKWAVESLGNIYRAIPWIYILFCGAIWGEIDCQKKCLKALDYISLTVCMAVLMFSAWKGMLSNAFRVVCILILLAEFYIQQQSRKWEKNFGPVKAGYVERIKRKVYQRIRFGIKISSKNDRLLLQVGLLSILFLLGVVEKIGVDICRMVSSSKSLSGWFYVYYVVVFVLSFIANMSRIRLEKRNMFSECGILMWCWIAIAYLVFYPYPNGIFVDVIIPFVFCLLPFYLSLKETFYKSVELEVDQSP